MSYSIKTIPKFDKQLKKLIRKYPSFKIEFTNFITSLREDPVQGIPLGNNCYKIRLSIASKGKGKSGGARLITSLIISETIVYLISIYDKSEKESLSDKELDDLLKYLPN